MHASYLAATPNQALWRTAPHVSEFLVVKAHSHHSMKMHRHALVLLYLFAMSRAIADDEIPWTPDLPYNADRRQSSSDNYSGAWEATPAFRRVEYRLTYLLEADLNAKKLRLTVKLPEAEGSLLYKAIDDLDEVLEVCYREAIPCLKDKPNPNLLLMMLYHYDAYVHSAMERWEPTIDLLRKLDPAIAEKAQKLADSKKALKTE